MLCTWTQSTKINCTRWLQSSLPGHDIIMNFTWVARNFWNIIPLTAWIAVATPYYLFFFLLSGIDWSGESYNYPVLEVIQYARPQPISHKKYILYKTIYISWLRFFNIIIYVFYLFDPLIEPLSMTAVLYEQMSLFSPRFFFFDITYSFRRSSFSQVICCKCTADFLHTFAFKVFFGGESDVLPLTLYPSFRHLQTCPLRLWHCSYGEIDKCIKLRFCCIIKFSYLT